MINGIRVSKPGYPVESATPPQLVYSSEYATLRVQQQGSGTMTHTGGRTITIAHNLGYVPMFSVHSTIPHLTSSSYYFNLPFYDDRSNLYVQYPEHYVLVYADSTNLYIKANNDFGWIDRQLSGSDGDWATRSSSGSHWYDFAEMGNSFGNTYDMALRFTSIPLELAESTYISQIIFKIFNRTGSGDLRGRIWGIEQPNTASFSSGDDPWSRPTHDGSGAVSFTVGSGAGSGSTETWTVTSIVNELAGQGSWVSGNPMAFVINDNSSDSSNTIESDTLTKLRILKSNTLLSYRYTIFKDRIE